VVFVGKLDQGISKEIAADYLAKITKELKDICEEVVVS